MGTLLGDKLKSLEKDIEDVKNGSKQKEYSSRHAFNSKEAPQRSTTRSVTKNNSFSVRTRLHNRDTIEQEGI